MVRPQDESVPAEPISSGRAGAAEPEVFVNGTGGGLGGTSTSHADVVTASDIGAREPQLRGGKPWLVTRTFDATAFNEILNDPYVFPFVAKFGDVKLDVSPLLSEENVLLVADTCGILFLRRDHCIYEVHTAFVPDASSIKTKGDICLDAYHWMFTNTDCMVLRTMIPAHNRAAEVFAPLLNWTKQFERKNAWHTVDGNKVDVSFWSIYYDEWVRKTPNLAESGRWFHRRLIDELARHGNDTPRHDYEECHERHAGALVEMLFGGQPEKSVAIYNNWAKFAGYGTISLVASAPLVIDIGDAVIHVVDNTFTVLKCR